MKNVCQSVEELVSEYEDYIRDIRREFHKIPEIGLDTFETSEYIKKTLVKIGIPFQELGSKKTGIVATINNHKKHTIGIRADIDGLRVKEETNLNFSSLVSDQMHACGHDAHAAMCLGCAFILSELKGILDCNVQLIFQPGEEGFAGAKDMIENGFANVQPFPNEIIAVHVFPAYKVGQIAYRNGAATASYNSIRVVFEGKVGHSADSSNLVNPILMASEFINRTQKMLHVLNESSPSALVTFTLIRSSEAYASTPRYVYLYGNARCLSMSTTNLIESMLNSTLDDLSKEHKCKYTYTFDREKCYIPGINNPDVISKVTNTKFKDIQIINAAQPFFGADDFAFFQEVLPGAYFELGCASDRYPATSLHRSDFMLDESCLKVGVKFFCTYIASYLESDVDH